MWPTTRLFSTLVLRCGLSHPQNPSAPNLNLRVVSSKKTGWPLSTSRCNLIRVSPNKKPIYGTGFIIGSDGYVLTAKHNLSGFVSPDVTPISVRIGSLDGQQVSAHYIPFDVGIDVAMLKLRNPIGVGLTAYRTVKRGD